MSDDLHGAVGVLLGDDGQRYTAGRRSLVEVLGQAGRPLTAAEILEAGSLPQSSAYRNLAVLEACIESSDPTSLLALNWPRTSPIITTT